MVSPESQDLARPVLVLARGGGGPWRGCLSCLLPCPEAKGSGLVHTSLGQQRQSMFLDSASSLWGPGIRETPSWASHSSGCPLKPHGPHARTEAGPEPSGAQTRGGGPGRRRSRALGPRSWWPGAPRVGPPGVGQGATHSGPPACVCSDPSTCSAHLPIRQACQAPGSPTLAPMGAGRSRERGLSMFYQQT